MFVLILFVALFFGHVSSDQCGDLQKEIANYEPTVKQIIAASTAGSFKGFTYQTLADLVDTFGNRFTGSNNLERAIDYMLYKSLAQGLDNVHGEEVKVPHWVRGDESAMLLQPFNKPLSILGLGTSVGTPVEGITAQVLVVKTFDELKQKAALAKGKIVVYNQDFISYGISVQYRVRGASEAAKVGAVASLIRSVTPFSLYSPHTGSQSYDSGVSKIPSACITVEDAHMLQRMQDRRRSEGQTVP